MPPAASASGLQLPAHYSSFKPSLASSSSLTIAGMIDTIFTLVIIYNDAVACKGTRGNRGYAAFSLRGWQYCVCFHRHIGFWGLNTGAHASCGESDGLSNMGMGGANSFGRVTRLAHSAGEALPPIGFVLLPREMLNTLCWCTGNP